MARPWSCSSTVAITVHGLKAGTDARGRAYEWLTVASVSAVIVLVCLRLAATRHPRHAPARAPRVSVEPETSA